jgi:Ca2+-transporting ATPase
VVKKDDFLKTGLSSKEAPKLLKKFGPNELAKPPGLSNLKLLFSQLKSPLVYVLLFAGIVTLFLREFTDSIVIFAAVLINTILGFWQERKAQKALVALRSLLTPKATVIRDGKQQEIEASEVVPGDLVVLTIGTRVPADGVLVEATDLSINEAILTGEAMPVKKLKTSTSAKASADRENLKMKTDEIKKENQAFMGTTVVTGIAKMLVAKTGMETEMGKIGKQLGEVEEEKTPLQEQLANLAKILAIVVGGVAVLIFVLGSILGYELVEMFVMGVAIAVAAIPEGLVVTLTVILALGMQRILKRKALVRQLLATETLGSVSVICADKTGTLTEGKLQVVKDDFINRELGVRAAILCNDMRDPLEVAMMDWALRQPSTRAQAEGVQGKLRKVDPKIIEEKYPRLDEMPFSPQTKMIATLHQSPITNHQSPNILFVSGAPEVVLGKCNTQQATRKTWLKKFEEYGEKGYRLVGFAHKSLKSQVSSIKNSDLEDLTWLGILIYEDPVREGVKAVLKECQGAGIKVKVITGDYALTALAVLKQLDFKLDPKTQVMEGAELEKISQGELKKKVGEIVLFARTDPEQKLKIVDALKEGEEVVAMMGDGVNDAPALKEADIGIVVGEASDVAKETADIVLLDSKFATIVHAIEEGRAIFENIKKVIVYLLSDSFTEVILIGGSLVMGLPLPLTAAQILWVNLVEDTFPSIALAFEPGEKEVMEEPPRERTAPILDAEMKALIFIIGLFTDLILLGLYYVLFRGAFPLSFIRTIIFAALAIDSLFYVFSCRSLRKTIFQRNPLGNKVLNISVLLGLLFLLAAIYLPFLQVFLKTHALGFKEWFLIFTLGVFEILAIEITKWIFISRKARNKVLR